MFTSSARICLDFIPIGLLITLKAITHQDSNGVLNSAMGMFESFRKREGG